MGYDIVTIEGNAQEARDFAKHYNYDYLFDKDGNYVGGDQVYFRANIWGMRYVAVATSDVLAADGENVTQEFYDKVMTAISYNQGDVLMPEDIEIILNAANASVLDIDKMARRIVEDGWHPDYDGPKTESEVDKRAKFAAGLIEEWFSYLSIAKDNGGLQVW